MSFADGWAAINLDMPKRVPRTEYSVSTHWDLVKVVTGIDVSANSPDDLRIKAERAFVKEWNFDFMWSTLIAYPHLGKYYTNMGHAEYADGGTDYNTNFTNPSKTPEEVLCFDPVEKLGKINKKKVIKDFEFHYKQNMEAYPDAVNMTGIYITLVSGLIDLFGWDMFLMSAGIDSEKFGEVANRYSEWIQQYFDALAEADVPVVMVHDDIVWISGAFMHPEWYRKYVFPNLKKQIAPLIDSGKKVMFTSDANYTEFIDDIANCGVHGFILEPSTDMEYIAQKYGNTHIFIGNADTRVLLYGTKEEIRAEVDRCMKIGKNCPGYFMAVGNHIPSYTPVENALYYNEVYEERSVR
ncbi:MAG: uroporphyrinogen decarboxylase family protein [Armatimonadota bacterium]